MQRQLRLTLFAAWATLMALGTYVLGAPPLKVLRRRVGRAAYWGLVVAVTAGLELAGVKGLGLSFFSIGSLIGVFEEFEDMGFDLVSSAFFTVLLNAMMLAGGFAFWVFSVGAQWHERLATAVNTVLQPSMERYPILQINAAEVVKQLPSAILCLWLVSLYVGVLLEKRLSVGDLAAREPHTHLRGQLVNLRMPDVCVWIFILSLLGVFGEFGGAKMFATVSVNVFNVCLLLFLFQGLGVLSKFFTSLRMGVAWQTVLLLLLVLQLGFLVSLLGLLDFWLNFRVRLEKRAGQIRRET